MKRGLLLGGTGEDRWEGMAVGKAAGLGFVVATQNLGSFSFSSFCAFKCSQSSGTLTKIGHGWRG